MNWIIKHSTEYVLILEDTCGWWRARVRLDGCVDLRRSFARPVGTAKEEDVDTLHICDLDDFIEMLIDLKKQAINHFQEWPQ